MTKLQTLKATAIALVASLSISIASGDEGHDEIKAPNGGRIVESIEPHFEVFIRDDRTVSITFLNEEGEVLSPSDQEISLIGGDRSNPTRLSFSKSGNMLVSDGKLPEDNGIPIILNIKSSPDAQTIREKFNLNMFTCPECDLAEYACICGHAEGHH